MPCAVFTTVSRSAASSRTRVRTVFSSAAPPVLVASASARRAWAWLTDCSAASTAYRAPSATARATAAWAARRLRRSAARCRVARSVAAAAVSEPARPPIARSRSSAVLTSSLASISALRAAVHQPARSSRTVSFCGSAGSSTSA